jgi:hypothetical protein
MNNLKTIIEKETADVIRQLDLQWDNPSEKVESDEYLEGIIAGLKWVSTQLA